MDGDIPGWGQLKGRINTTMEGCSEECSKHEGCCSYEYSFSSRLCNLNKDCEPTQGKYKDYHFCTKGFSTGDLTGVDVETAPVKQPYDDGGSGAGGNFACFNPSLSGPQLDAGYTMVASIPSNVYHGIKSGSVFKPKNQTLFSYPNDFKRIWTDGGSGGDLDGSFWKPHCPLGYYALGHYCQKGYDKPDLRSMKCVHLSLVEECTSKLIWTDKGSGAYEDGAVYKSSDRQVMGMYTAPNYRYHPQAYCFKRN